MAKVLMVQGTMSGAGKSLLVAGLCRIFRQDGHRVAPFKSQNMALNSFVTSEGLEMGRAQVMQAEAAGISPMVRMNPILLKPTGHMGSQVIINGEVFGNMEAMEYFQYKKKLMPVVLDAFCSLEEEADIIVVEGAGSPAEINLREHDIVNMGLAQALNAPVLLVGDIDRGGVFAQLLGTLMLLSEEERERTMGLIVNKFRGDRQILEPGIQMLEERAGKPVVGVVPFMELDLEDEDSLTERFERNKEGVVQIAVIHYPCISNFTDVAVFERMPRVSVRYVTKGRQLDGADLILLPGSKNTMGDLRWLRQAGLEDTIRERSLEIPVVGICGGFQMLGEQIRDPEGVEEGGEIAGIGLLPMRTLLKKEKIRTQCEGEFAQLPGLFAPLCGKRFAGYEIHMGETFRSAAAKGEGSVTPFGQCTERSQAKISRREWADGACRGNVYGTYIHGVFDEGDIAETLVRALAEKKGVAYHGGAVPAYRAYKEQQYDKLAQVLRENLDMAQIYGMLREACLKE